MAKRDHFAEREQTGVALLMAWTAGGVEAIGFLLLFHLFIGPMSGNSDAFGAFLSQGEWKQALWRAFPIPVFALGIFIGSLLVEYEIHHKRRSPLRKAYALEAMLIVAALLIGEFNMQAGHLASNVSPAFYMVAILLALAMGAQSATLRHRGNLQFFTAFVTGMMTNAVREFAASLFWLSRRTHGRSRRRWLLALRLWPRFNSSRHSFFFTGICATYVIGAILGSWAEYYWHWIALLVPLAGLVVILLEDNKRPLSGTKSIENRVS